MIEHFASKGSEKGIHTYLIANSDEDVYEWLKLEKKLKDERRLFVLHSQEEVEKEVFELYDDKYNEIGKETYKERMIRLKGNINDDNVELENRYYGETLIGWKTIKENISAEETSILMKSGISLELFENS